MEVFQMQEQMGLLKGEEGKLYLEYLRTKAMSGKPQKWVVPTQSTIDLPVSQSQSSSEWLIVGASSHEGSNAHVNDIDVEGINAESSTPPKTSPLRQGTNGKFTLAAGSGLKAIKQTKQSQSAGSLF